MEGLSALSLIRSKLGQAELVAVSKTKPIEKILELYREGQHVFGENYVQELVEKKAAIDRLKISDIEFHFIGHLQTNKVKVVLPCVTTIHSVDSLRLYEEILKRAELIQKKIRVYFQVNIDDEASKGGFKTNELSELSVFVKTHSSEWVKPIGFMCIPDPNQDSTQAFQKMKKISEQFSATLGNQLSMGMSDDFEKAIAAGATSVRIGSALFGARE